MGVKSESEVEPHDSCDMKMLLRWSWVCFAAGFNAIQFGFRFVTIVVSRVALALDYNLM